MPANEVNIISYCALDCQLLFWRVVHEITLLTKICEMQATNRSLVPEYTATQYIIGTGHIAIIPNVCRRLKVNRLTWARQRVSRSVEQNVRYLYYNVVGDMDTYIYARSVNCSWTYLRHSTTNIQLLFHFTIYLFIYVQAIVVILVSTHVSRLPGLVSAIKQSPFFALTWKYV